jgi:hypothetical protein
LYSEIFVCYLYLFTYKGVQQDFHIRWYLCHFSQLDIYVFINSNTADVSSWSGTVHHFGVPAWVHPCFLVWLILIKQ